MEGGSGDTSVFLTYTQRITQKIPVTRFLITTHRGYQRHVFSFLHTEDTCDSFFHTYSQRVPVTHFSHLHTEDISDSFFIPTHRGYQRLVFIATHREYQRLVFYTSTHRGYQ